MVVRYQGGDNAGHTVVRGDEVFKLRLTPRACSTRTSPRSSATGWSSTRSRSSTSWTCSPRAASMSSRVRVSRSAHVIMPYHVALDQANERRLGGAAVGTTGRGIGPTYGDRAWRLGLRMEDLLDPAVLRERIERALPDKNLLLGSMGAEAFTVDGLVDEALGWGERLRDHLDDTTWLVQAALARGEHVLLEGAQGTLLDLDHGSYPVRDLVQPGRRRGVHRRGHRAAPGRRGHRGHEGVLDPGRLGPVPDRAARRGRRRHRRAWPRVRDGHRPAAPGRLVRCRAAALRGGRQQHQLDHAQQAGHPVGRPPAAHLRGLRARRQARRGLAVERRGAGPGDPDLRGLRGLGRAHPRHPLAGRPARERAALRRAPSRPTRACPSCSCRSGRSAARPSSGRGGRCATGRASRHERRAPRDADPHPDRGCRRSRARPGLEAGRRARASTRSSWRPAAPASAWSPGSAACPAWTRWTAPRSWPPPGPWPRARRHRSRGAPGGRASPMPARRPVSRSSGRPPRPPGSRRRRRSAARSPRRPACPWPAAARSAPGPRPRPPPGPSPRTLAADGAGIVVKADGLAAGKGVTVCEHARRGPGRRGRPGRRPASWSRSAWTVPRSAASPCATARTRWPCPSPATTSASWTATRARTRVGWAPAHRCPTPRTPMPTRSWPPSTDRSWPSWPAAASRSVARCTPG